MKLRLLAVLAFSLPFMLLAQEFRGTLEGRITDPEGAVIAEAKVTVTEVHTGTRSQTVSDSSGRYTAPFLLAGDYDIVVQVPGFREAVRKGVHLGAGDHLNIDVPLTVGDTTQTIDVTADAPLLNTENASVGGAVTTKEVEDLPSNGGTPYMAIGSSMGVIATSSPSQVLPFASGGGSSWSISGSPNQTNELLVDGVPNTRACMTWVREGMAISRQEGFGAAASSPA